MDDWVEWMLFRRVHYDLLEYPKTSNRKCPFDRMVQRRNAYVRRTVNWIHKMFDDQSKS